MTDDEIRLVGPGDLHSYPNGVVAGEVIVLRTDIVHRNEAGERTGKVTLAGSRFVVLPGVKEEPEVIWLRDTNGERCTWDADSFDAWFERP